MKTDKRVVRRREIQSEAAYFYSKIINECSTVSDEEFYLFLIALSAKITNDLNRFITEDFDKERFCENS